MISKKKLPKKSKLCVIIDMGILTRRAAIRAARSAVKAGADMIQLRCKGLDTLEVLKTAIAVRQATKGRAAFVVNDRADIAIAAGADGVHIGNGDISPALAGRLLGKRLLGVSASGINEAVAAKRSGASYLGVGPIFKTPVKNEKRASGTSLLSRVNDLNIPFFAIGGINIGNIARLTAGGFRRIAVIRAVCSSNSPYLATLRLKKALEC